MHIHVLHLGFNVIQLVLKVRDDTLAIIKYFCNTSI